MAGWRGDARAGCSGALVRNLGLEPYVWLETKLETIRSYTSTRKNYYTGLIETSKKHFYGRAAAELSFSDLVLGTFTAAQRPVRVLVIALVVHQRAAAAAVDGSRCARTHVDLGRARGFRRCDRGARCGERAPMPTDG